LFPPDCICRMKKTQKSISRMIGNQVKRYENQGLREVSLTVMMMLFSRRILTRSSYCEGATLLNALPSVNLPLSWLPDMVTSMMFPLSTSSINSLKFISFWLAPGDWRRLHRTIMMIPAAIQKMMLLYVLGGLLMSGMIYSF